MEPGQNAEHQRFREGGIFCVGFAVSRGNARCRWRIADDRQKKVCLILNKMGTKPPTKIYDSELLSQLATLSLCEEHHQHQHPDVLDRWNDMIGDVAGQYEETKELKKRNCQLKAKLVEECEVRERLERLLAKESADSGVKRLSAQLGELKSQFAESEARESDLLLQVKDCEHLLAESCEEAECLKVQQAELSRQLARERRISAQRQQDHEVTARQVDGLQSQLFSHRQVSEQLNRDLDRATTDREGLLAQTEILRAQSTTESQSLKQVERNLVEAEMTQTALLKKNETLQSQLATESQSLNEVKRNLDEAGKSQAGLLKDKETLQSQLATESQSLNQVQKNLVEAKTTQAALSKEKGTLESQLSTERQTSGQLAKKQETLEAELASVQATLECTQHDLTQSRKANEEQAAADAAAQAATVAATAQLLERIRQLEEQSRFSFLSAIIGRIKGLAGRIALWARCGRWPRRRNGTGGDMV
jgi:chromosome segregation ATPase